MVDGALFAFQKQTIHQKDIPHLFWDIGRCLERKIETSFKFDIEYYLVPNENKLAEIRQQASDLIAIIAPVIKQCSEHDDELLMKLILILYESLGEVYPEVLGSILNALYSCLDSIDKSTLYTMSNPSINQILPTLTPILKNRHEKFKKHV